jgi:hypothetical protein
LAGLANQQDVLNALPLCSDHLPVLQTYLIAAPRGGTHFGVTVDANPVVAGSAFSPTVAALDGVNQVATGYRGTVSFASADPYRAVLPGSYAFQGGDAGAHTFVDGARLFTAGTGDVTATGPAYGLRGSASVGVRTAPNAAFFILVPPWAARGVAFDVTVVAVDADDHGLTNYAGAATWTTTGHDPAVIHLADYGLQPSDAGMATFLGGVTLLTPGDQTLTATDLASGITGTVTVSL